MCVCACPATERRVRTQITGPQLAKSFTAFAKFSQSHIGVWVGANAFICSIAHPNQTQLEHVICSLILSFGLVLARPHKVHAGHTVHVRKDALRPSACQTRSHIVHNRECGVLNLHRHAWPWSRDSSSRTPSDQPALATMASTATHTHIQTQLDTKV